MIPANHLCRALILFTWVTVLRPSLTAPQTTTPKNTAPTIQVNVNRVFVSVVVRDRQGRSVSDLKKEDFQIFDNDKAQVISNFNAQRRSPENTAGNKSEAGTNAASPGEAPLLPPSTQRFIVFMFDDIHLSVEDLAAAKKAGLQATAGALVDSDIAAVVSTSGQTNSGLTRDRGKLKDAIVGLQLRGISRNAGADCPNIDYYQADLIANKHDDRALQDAVREVLDCDPGLDPKRDIQIAERLANSTATRDLVVGDQDATGTYAVIREFVRRMANLPGQRILILLSPGFLTLAPEALTGESQLLDLAARSDVTISALDARGLYTTELEASQRSPSLSGAGGSVQQQADYRRTSMSLGEGTMASIAAGTGGTFFHNNNDLGAGLARLTAVPECVYLLEFSSENVKPDGTYHRLMVKVDREGVQIQARRGYFASKPDKKK
jgi:VWFA-related protein